MAAARDRPDPLAVLSERERRLAGRAAPAGWMEPMLATATDERFSSDRWLFERKLDGVRAVVCRTGGDVTLWSRNRKPMAAAYPELAGALRDAAGPDLVADGEIVAFDGERTSFGRLQARIHLTDPVRIEATGVEVYLYLFDLLQVGDADLRQLPLHARKRVLWEAVDFAEPVRFSEFRMTDGEAYYEHACRNGWEGLVAKRLTSRYQAGRSRDWLKFTCLRGQELVVGGFTDPKGGRTGFGALLVGYFAGGRLRYAGKVGTGYDQATLRDLHARLRELERADRPFDDPVREPGVHWVDPVLVAEVAFSEWTSDGRLRQPRYLGLRTDKPAGQVVREP